MSRSRLLVGSFGSDEGLLDAVRAARKAGLSVHDVYTPFPVHGMDEAMGLAPSKLPRFCFAFGAAGLLLTLAFQFWVSLFNWPMNIGGKSYDASPALVPIAFELTVLFAGLGTVATFLRLRRLFPGRRPFLAASGGVDDRFVLALRLDAAKVKAEAARRFLEEQGAAGVEEMEDRA